MKAIRSLERPAATTAGSILAALSLLLLVVTALRPAGIVVVVTAGLVLACLGLCVAVAVGQERSARRNLERAEEFARRNRRTGTRAMEKETER